MEFRKERKQLQDWVLGKIRKHGADAIERYIAVNNDRSIDGLPGLATAPAQGEDVQRFTSLGRKL